MITEILEALSQHYGADSDEYAECLAYLYSMGDRQYTLWRTSLRAELNRHNRCPCCGAKLESKRVKQWHNEVEFMQGENRIEIYCPNGCYDI